VISGLVIKGVAVSWVTSLERWVSRRLQKKGFVSREVATSVSRIHIHDKKGDGTLPPLVLLHGITASGTTWAPMLMHFARHFKRVLVVDAPGHGFSEIPSQPLTAQLLFKGIAEVLNKELEEPAVICGNSLGGGGTLKYALEYPEMVKGIVLLSPAGAWMDEEQLVDFQEDFTFRSKKDTREFLEKLYHKPPPFVPLLLSGEILRRFNQEHIQQILDTVTEDDFFKPDELSTLDIPGVFFWGRSERILPSHSLTYYKQHLPPGIRVMEPEGFGHSPHLDDPAAIAKIVVELGQQVAAKQLTA
jgi:pimeloyl-ACP methyl ester carboxylesterase